MVTINKTKTYIIFASKTSTDVYEVVYPNIETIFPSRVPPTFCGDAYDPPAFIGPITINMEVEESPKKIEFDDVLLSRLARYNLEQGNKTLLSEIAFHENRLADLKNKIGHLSEALDRAKIIAKGLVDGKTYIDEDDESDDD